MAKPLCWFDNGRVLRVVPAEVLPDGEAQYRVRVALREAIFRI